MCGCAGERERERGQPKPRAAAGGGSATTQAQGNAPEDAVDPDCRVTKRALEVEPEGVALPAGRDVKRLTVPEHMSSVVARVTPNRDNRK